MMNKSGQGCIADTLTRFPCADHKKCLLLVWKMYARNSISTQLEVPFGHFMLSISLNQIENKSFD